MHKVVFYPVGNGDTSQIILENKKRILSDFHHTADGEDDEDPKIDLAETLRSELKEADRDSFDVVVFTHSDRDHTKGASDFFYFDHAKEYQDDDRIKIDTLWVPAAMILEEGLKDDARVIRQEARHRLKKGYGVRVFSKPDKLKKWLESEGLTVEERKEFLIDAGNLVPDFSLDEDEVEFFVHSPYMKHIDDDSYEIRNEAAAILHATFNSGERETRYLMVGDSTYEIMSEIVDITRNKKREERLQWDLYSVPHHCSYLALNESGEKGEKETHQ